MQRFVRVSQTGDVNCLVQGSFDQLKTEDGTTLQQLFDEGFRVTALTALSTGMLLIALARSS